MNNNSESYTYVLCYCAKKILTTDSIFGKTASSGAGSLFGATPSKEGSNTGTFSFGGAATGAAKPMAFGAPAGGSAPAPSFSFGGSQDASKPALAFGTPAGGNNAPKPVTFGASASGNAASSFTFGGNAPTAATTSTPAAASTFGFGGSSAAAPKPAGSSSATAAPAFQLGASSDSAASKSATAAAPAPSLNFGFGGAASSTSKPTGGLFGAPVASQAEKKDDKPASTFSFGSTATAPASTSSVPPFGLGGASTEKKDAAPTATAPGTFNFGGAAKKDATATATPSFSFGGLGTSAKPAAPAGGLFGGASSTTQKDDKPFAAPAGPTLSFGGAAKTAPTATPAGAAGASAPAFSLGGASKPAETKAAAAPAFAFGGATAGKPAEKKDDDKQKKDDEKEEKTVSFTNSVISRDEKKDTHKTVEPQPVTLNNKTLEDLITKWTNQLTKASGSYQSYSEQVKQWDSVLVEGGDKISQLYTDVVAAEQTQSKIEQQLLYVERQQSELETFLDNYEVKAENLLSEVLSSTTQQRDSSVITNDQKRAQAYRTAELLDENLSSLGLNLSSLITEINDVSDSFNKANGLGKDGNSDEEENSLNQIVKLLNTHLDSLKWIEKNSDELKGKLDHFKGLDL